jgi:hypothetical protein
MFFIAEDPVFCKLTKRRAVASWGGGGITRKHVIHADFGLKIPKSGVLSPPMTKIIAMGLKHYQYLKLNKSKVMHILISQWMGPALNVLNYTIFKMQTIIQQHSWSMNT